MAATIEMDRVQVAVRVRPLNSRERERGETSSVVEMQVGEVLISP
jgi:hypothetical protein